MCARVGACGRACLRTYLRTYVRAIVCARVRACVRVRGRHYACRLYILYITQRSTHEVSFVLLSDSVTKVMILFSELYHSCMKQPIQRQSTHPCSHLKLNLTEFN